MELIRALQLLKLNSVSSAWVDAVWDFEFTHTDPLDPVIEEEIKEDPDVFKRIYKQLLPFSSKDDDNTQSVWLVFGENGVSAKPLVAVLSYFILSAKAKSPSLEQRLCGLQAASLYLLLLKIPGSVANKVYHQILFDTCLNMPLKCWPQDSGKKRKKDTLKSSQGDPKTGKRSKPPKKVSEEWCHVSSQAVCGARDQAILFISHIVEKQREAALPLLRILVQHICHQMVEKSEYRVSGAQAVGKLMAKMPCQDYAAIIKNVDQIQSLPELSYHGLGLLCSTIHGEGDECRRRVFRKLLYVILMMKTQERSKPCLLASSQAVCGARDQAILFISHIVEKQREAALPLLRILVQHICHQMVEKSEYRVSGAQAVGKLMAKMPCQDYAAIIKWLYSYSRNNKVAFRMFALDVALVLLEQSERDVDDTVDPELAVFLPHRFLVHNIIYNHRNDVSPTVRGHALHCLAQCLELGSQNATKCVHELFSNSAQTMLESGRSEQTLKRRETVQKSALTFRTIELTKHKSITTTHRSVMNSSLQNEETLTLFKKHVSDPKINARKSALEKALECLDHVVIAHIKSQGKYRDDDTSQKLAWDLLGLMCEKCQDLSRYFSKTFSVWAPQQKFTPAFVNGLLSHTDGERAAAAWLLLAKIASCSPKLNYGTVLDTWENTIRSPVVSVTMTCHILSVLGDIASNLNDDTKTRIVDDLMGWLKTFSLPLEVISSCVDTLVRFSRSDNTPDTLRFLDRFCGELVSVCESYLSGVILQEKGAENINEGLLVKHLYTLGAASLHCPFTSFVDSELPLDSDSSELLSDTFDILSLKEMKLTAMSGPAAGEEPQEDEMAMAKAVLQVAQKKLVSQVQKRNFVENVIPIIISLKNMLEEQHSPVLKHLMAYLQVTMQDYRSEVKELFAADEQLTAEVEYNLKWFEKEKQQQEQQQMENQLANFTFSPQRNATHVGGQTGFASPLNPHGTKGPAQTPKSADALRRRTYAGMVTPVRTHSSPTVFSTGRGKQVGRAISTPQASINEVTFGEQVSAICNESRRVIGSKVVDEEESVLHLMSPEQQKPVPRQWNVESPLVQKLRSKKRF
ncbi:condensin-2 complex subunit D3-like [Sinocyclocheilus grahami]|uniref:condensin-2 complex subunit D3-like n=1 Tax=Sinocyclocheilus grahami TaxID=75366 RepID=UPI0007ACEF63|nr:PREDICTED: condensin-2 complex subunit D3-like [Sinocyclocheilus grahami]